jgi:hypothetical protein
VAVGVRGRDRTDDRPDHNRERYRCATRTINRILLKAPKGLGCCNEPCAGRSRTDPLGVTIPSSPGSVPRTRCLQQDGRDDRARTCDLRFPEAARYLAALHPEGGPGWTRSRRVATISFMRYILSIFMLSLAIAIFARNHGVPQEDINDLLRVEHLQPLLSAAALVVTCLVTWAAYRVVLVIRQRRQAARAR